MPTIRVSLRQSNRQTRDGSPTSVGGFFRPRQLEAAGLTVNQLPALIRAGLVVREGRGLYRRRDVEATEDFSLDAHDTIEAWRLDYETAWPHSGLAGRTPAEFARELRLNNPA